jgi:hypothetical protein
MLTTAPKNAAANVELGVCMDGEYSVISIGVADSLHAFIDAKSQRGGA